MNMNLASVLACSLMVVVVSGVSLQSDFDITWGDGRGKFLNDGELITLSLDKFSGSGYQSKSEYLFGKIEMDIKLVPGDSAGTVTTFYLSSQGSNHDEIDFEFLGNLSGDPYTVHTNVFSQGKGDKERQLHLWFDPTMDFHTYSILWNPKHIIFSIDGVPIRDFRNSEEKGVPFPTNQAMRVYSSIWDADDWATRGGLVKTDWTKAPFTASFKNFQAKDACKWSESSSDCHCTNPTCLNQILDAPSLGVLQEMQKKYMIYDYCSDLKRFPMGLSPECTDNTAGFELK